MPRLVACAVVRDNRVPANWFNETAPEAFQGFYDAARRFSGVADLPLRVVDLETPRQRELRSALSARVLPLELQRHPLV